jgi:hypothetical protein
MRAKLSEQAGSRLSAPHFHPDLPSRSTNSNPEAGLKDSEALENVSISRFISLTMRSRRTDRGRDEVIPIIA